MDFAAAAGMRSEAERWLLDAVKLLAMRDLEGSKLFASRAMEYDPFLDGVDEVLAVADVLLAAQRRVNNHVDWYAVLRLPHPSVDGSGGPDSSSSLEAVKRQYRYFALLLRPERNRNPGADYAFKLVSDAFSILSNPVKKSLFDAQLRVAASVAAGARVPATKGTNPTPSSHPGEPFWTACPSCCYVHQYAREYVNLSLRCPTCCRAFFSSELAAPPTIVPGSDKYQCAWGFFPLGYPNGPKFNFDANWKPFHPVHPSNDARDTREASRQPANGHSEAGATVQKENAGQPPKPAVLPGRNKKRMAQKRVGRPPIKSARSQERQGSGARPRGRDDEKADGFNGARGSVDCDVDVNFFIDMDVSDEITGDLQDLPFAF